MIKLFFSVVRGALRAGKHECQVHSVGSYHLDGVEDVSRPRIQAVHSGAVLKIAFSIRRLAFVAEDADRYASYAFRNE